ncbi:tetratricopeptide repeat-containing sensor histidine kinase [Halpernia frigidisoli]|uniref:tetratricopeptide repeat-containing sensor histidine kinase n=1 Tax=Halpernia frigidisoli TaxID=1125876 RepID=UPI001160B541|nr:tetratricopeptide repeat-containing sensor histidine kinase [Halpernia frigidisoli]
MEKKQQDSAFVYFNAAKDIFINQKDSLKVGKCLINMAIILADKGDYFGSQETSLSSIKYFNENNEENFETISANYNCLGIATQNLKNYKKAIYFYDKAIKFSADSLEKTKRSNNIAVAYSKLGDYKKSIKVFDELFIDKIVNQNQRFKFKILDNLAFTKFLQNKNYNAEPQLNKALEIREAEKDLWGQNASQAHLSDYFAYKNPVKSLFHAHKMYNIASQLKSPDDEIEALQKLVNLENTADSKKYFNIYLKLKDSLQTARNKAKNQFALVRYESEKNRADLLKSQAENTEKNYQLLVRNVALGLAFLATIIGIIWLKKRQERVKQEKELVHQENQLKIKNTELKYSKKIHDVVSNGVYQVMSEIENNPNIDKPEVLNKLEKIYEKSRDISYENLLENTVNTYKIQISNLVKSFSSDLIKPIIIGNEEDLWDKISSKIKTEFLIILQELLVNMKKHSEAKKLILKFEINKERLEIAYFDDGKGLGEIIQKKNGLQNTETRIFSCEGKLTFDETTGKGTKINISFPIKSD